MFPGIGRGFFDDIKDGPLSILRQEAVNVSFSLKVEKEGGWSPDVSDAVARAQPPGLVTRVSAGRSVNNIWRISFVVMRARSSSW